MQPSELFSACDKDRSDSIDLTEFKNFIRTLKESLMEKDLQAIENFFSQYDTSGNGKLSKSEFLTAFGQAQTKATSTKLTVAVDDDFAEADIEQADQGMFTDAFASVKGWFGGKKK